MAIKNTYSSSTFYDLISSEQESVSKNKPTYVSIKELQVINASPFV
jgi:hypothetical protein